MAKSRKSSSKEKTPYFLAMARIALGLTFLWAFFDKLMGLGFATCRNPKTSEVVMYCEKAWVNGGSPTSGFLQNAVKGPFADFYQSLAGNAFIDGLFMAGLFLIGFALVAGIGMRIATISGVVLMMMMWSASLFPSNNPILDEHIIYSIILLALLASNKQQVWGLRNWWVAQPAAKQFPILE